jgi:ParB family transcriptional regulator, chromosome partitioning protein
MTTTNAALDKTAAKAATEKVHEKLAEKRRALGRGLESLLPGPRVVPVAPAGFATGRPGTAVAPLEPTVDTPAEPATLDSLQAVASGQTADGESVLLLAQIDQNPYQTRREFDQNALRELTASIAVQGVLQPVVVRPGKEGRFILILGERRLRASAALGNTTIPAIVKRVSEQQAAEMTLVENLQRQDLNCVEQAEAFSNLSQKFNLTQEEIGKRAGVSRESVSNYMRLLTLGHDVVWALQSGKLTYSHARVLLKLRDNAQIWKYALKAIEEKMSVAKLEDLVFGLSVPAGAGEKNKGGGARWVDPNVKAAQRSLEEVLGMKVRIKDKKGRGKILIEYATLEDFDRVVGMLKGK